MKVRRAFWLALVCALLASGSAAAYGLLVPGSSHRGALPEITSEQQRLAAALRSHVHALAVRIGQRRLGLDDSLARARAYLERELAGLDLPRDAVRIEKLSGVPGDAANLVVDLPGERTAPRVVIGAHYDTAPGTPGANDNASGVAATLELAKRFSRTRLPRPLRFVFFANEEPPYFQSAGMGSLQHATGCRSRGERISAMLSLETMGYYTDARNSQQYPFPLSLFYPDRGNFIGFVANLSSRALLHDAVRAFRAHARFPSEAAALPASIPGVGWSDHWSFWQHDYPAIMVTDTAPFRYPHYHSASDRPEHVDFERLARVVDGLQHVISALASR